MHSQQSLATNLIMSHKESEQETPAFFAQLSDENLMLKTLTSYTTFICIHNLRTTCRTIERLLSPRQCHAARAGGTIVDSALFLVSRRWTVPGEMTSNDNEVRRQPAPFQWHVLVNGKWRDAPWSKESHPQVDDVNSTCANSDYVVFMQHIRGSCHHFLFRIQTGEKFILPDHGSAYRAICNFGDCLVLVGPSTILMSNKAIDRWRRLSNMPINVQCNAAGIIGQKLCIFGYLDNEYLVGQFALYDIEAETWEMGPRMPEKLGGVSGAVVGDMFHVVGIQFGRKWDHKVICFCFDPKSMAWKYTAPAECIQVRGSLTCHAVSHRGSLWMLLENRDTMNFWKKLEKDGSWTKSSSEVVPPIPAHVVGCIRTVGSVVFTVKE